MVPKQRIVSYGNDPSVCTGCGSAEIAASLQASLGIPKENNVISSTHTHASGDTVMALPSWYFDLIRDATKQAIAEAVANARPATIQTGTTPANPSARVADCGPSVNPFVG